MSSNLNPNVNDKVKERIKFNYGKYGEVKAQRGKVHELFEMTVDFTKNIRRKLGWKTMLKGLSMSSQ